MKFYLILLLTLQIFEMKAQQHIKADSEIKEVTVYLQGAQITRKVDISLKKGRSTVSIEKLPAGIQDNSIQVASKNKTVKVLGVNTQLDHLQEGQKSDEVQKLESLLEKETTELQKATSVLQVYEEEESLLKQNKVVAGQQTGLNVEDLKSLADYFRSRLLEILDKKSALQKSIKQHTIKINDLQAQLSQTNNKSRNPQRQIDILVEADVDMKASFEVLYTVQEAGWVPSYDIRAEQIENPVNLIYKANAYQTTGEEWNDVILTFSNADPSVSGVMPEIYPWYLYFYEKMDQAPSRSAAADYELAESSAVPMMLSATVVNRQTSFEFKLNEPHTVKSTGIKQSVDLLAYQIPAAYQYYSAPKLSETGYLTAKVHDWENLNLLSGEASIFFEGKYVGHTFLDPAETGDTLTLSLGVDKSIVIAREKIKEYTSKSFFGSNKVEVFAYKISVKNLKKEAVNLLIEDQIPVSQDSQISVKVLEIGEAKLEEHTGKLNWEVSVDPGESKEFTFKYEVKYPKDRSLALQ